eukprot:m51a1_g11261 hypothetical protein (490) ;mRNA; f:26095-32058
MVFADPDKCRPGAFNIWRGYCIGKDEAAKYRGHKLVYNQKEYSIETCLLHIFNFFANKNEDQPFERSCSVPILVSEEGIGKDLLLLHTMMAIIGKYHSLNTTSTEDIAGKFNSVLKGKVYVVYNEARSLDPVKADKLKSIITDKSLRVEHKFVDAYTIDNMVNILIFSNSTTEKIIDLSPQSRRYVHCLCNSWVNMHPEYFDGLSRWLGIADGQPVTEEGIKCFSDYLYNVNIAQFNSRRIVITDSLVDQKLASMHPVHMWWHECLSTGKIGYYCFAGVQRSPNAIAHVRANGIDTTGWAASQLVVDKNDLWDVYRDWVLECGKKSRIGANSVFWKNLHVMLEFENHRARALDGNRGTRFCTGATFYDTVPDNVGGAVKRCFLRLSGETRLSVIDIDHLAESEPKGKVGPMETTEQLVDGIMYDPDPIYTNFKVKALFTFLSQPITARVIELVCLRVEITHQLDLETSDRVVYEKDFLRLWRTDSTYTV